MSAALLVLTYARRELRAGLRGFLVLMACLALGVFAIAGVGSVSRALTEGLARQGQAINGGDLTVSSIGAPLDAGQQAFLAGLGRTSRVAALRAMLRTSDGRSTLVELKAVDAAYPLSGQATLASGRPIQHGIAGSGTMAVAEPALLAQLDLKPGATALIGTGQITVSDQLLDEPDRLAGGIGFGPRLLVSLDTLQATGLVQPGSLIRWSTRILLPSDVQPAAAAARVRAAYPDAGWEILTRDDAAPELRRGIERFTGFLTLVGLTALVVGGVGIANAITAFLETKRDTIAALKALGAPGGTVFAIYLAQAMLLGLIGIVLGLLLGALLPFALVAAFGSLLPLPVEPALFPRELLVALAEGILAALAFTLWPLGRTHDIAVSALFRDVVEPVRRWPRLPYVAATALAALALIALAVWVAADRRLALTYVAGALGAFVLLRLTAGLVMTGAARLPRGGGTALRLAIGNIHRPGALTPSVILSLGLGLCLLVALALVDGNVRRQLAATLPERAPAFFVLDIPEAQARPFEARVVGLAPGSEITRVPMLRGRITAVKGTPIDQVKPSPEAAWALQGDRGVTFSDALPKGSALVAGRWWDAAARSPQVSLEDRVARGLGLSVGDTITVAVLGRPITATVANLRRVEWDNLGINFVLVFSSSTFAGAPVTDLATIAIPGAPDLAREAKLLQAITDDFPTVTAIRVRDALDRVGRLAGQLALGIRGAASVALVASVLVLSGALAAGRRARTYDAVVLKVLGATRARLLAAYLLEYGLLGLVSAAVGLIAGTIAAWYVVVHIMGFAFTMLPDVAIGAALGSVAFTVVIGLIGTWRVLGQSAAPSLRVG